MNESGLRQLFIDICRGYTKQVWGKTPIYIRHFSHFEQLDIELERETYFQLARNKKIPTLEEKVEWLIKEDLWSKKNDKKIRDLTGFVEGLTKSKSKALTKAMGDDYQKQINETQFEIDKLTDEKRRLVGLTAESYADEKMQSSYILYGFYKDPELKERFFTEKKYKSLDDEEIEELLIIYINYIIDYSHDKLKKLSIAQFFTSYFYLSDDLTKFFNKPICDLTYNQVNLISYGSYYRSIISSLGEGIPEDVKGDPEKLEEYVNRKKNVKNVKQNGNGFTAVIGATEKDDGKFLGGAKNDTFSKGEIDTAWDGVKSGKLKIG